MRRLLLFALLAATLAAMAGCRRRKAEPPPPPPPRPTLPSSTDRPLPSPPVALPPPIETPKQPPPAGPAESLPQFPPAPQKREPAKPPRGGRKPAPPKPPAAEEAKPGTPPSTPPPLLGEALAPERRAELEREIASHLAEVDSAVEQIGQVRLDARQSETLLRLRSLAANARSMRSTEPTLAAQLAARAAVLARELLAVLKK